MPIAVTCAACSSSFTVKDDYAGKRAKCPKCSEPLTVPGGAVPPPVQPQVAPPALARPVVVAARVPPRPADGEDAPSAGRRRESEHQDERSAPKRRRDEEENDSPRRRREDDADADAPRTRRRRRDDDDEPKKKGSPLPLILGIVGAVLLLCCGGPTGVWLFWIKPAGEKFASDVKAFASEMKQEQAGREEFRNKLQQVKTGMSTRDVEQTLGSAGTKAVEDDVRQVTMFLSDWQQAEDRWKPKTRLGHVLKWDKSGDGVLVAFSTDPIAGGTVVGAVGTFGVNAVEPIRLPAESPPNLGTVSPVVLTADQLTDRQAELRDRTVIVTGRVASATNAAQGGNIVLARGPNKKVVRTTFAAANWKGEWSGGKMKAGDDVTIKGVVSDDPSGAAVPLRDCELVPHTPQVVKPDNRTPVATMSVDELAVNFGQMQGKWITLKGQFKDVILNGKGVSLIAPKQTAMAVIAPTSGTGFVWKDQPRANEALEFVGQVGGRENLMQLNEAVLVKREAAPVTPFATSAQDLAAEFSADTNAATKKYGEKTLTVSGTVERTTASGIRISLKGVAASGNRKAFVVDILMNAEKREEAMKVKVGDNVTLSGKFSNFRPATASAPNTVLLTGGKIEK